MESYRFVSLTHLYVNIHKQSDRTIYMAIEQKQFSVIFVTLQVWGWFPHTKQDSTFNLQTTRRPEQSGKCVAIVFR